MHFSEKSFEALEVMRKQFPKRCSCGHVYSQAEWLELPGKKLWHLPWGEVQEMRDCACGSTMNLVVVEDPTGGHDALGGADKSAEKGIWLRHFPVNLVWGFTFGGGLLRLENERMFYESRAEAVEAAQRHDLVVEKSNKVRVAHHGAMNG